MAVVTPTRTRAAILAVGATLLAGACAAPTPSAPSPSSVTGSPAVPSPTAPASVAPTSASASPSAPVPTGAISDRPDLAAVRVAVEAVASGLDAPLWVEPIPGGGGRLAVAEQGGRVRIVADGAVLPDPLLDIAERVTAGGERGLLGLAFPPGFGTERTTIFVHYSDRNGDTTVSSFEVPSAGPSTIDPSTERIRLAEPQPYANHNGGWIGFDPSGMLLIGLGDGGSGGDPQNRASDLTQRLGKILRIDVLGAATGEPYAIPADNPFVGRSDARPEILHFGLRNPFRASIDPVTGALWIGDVGQNAWEEVDVAPAGARGLDFGWRRWEGRHCFEPQTGCDPAGVTMPVSEYPHEAGCSVIGGVVYRGVAIPALRGAYLFSDYCSGTLWAIDAGLDAAQAPITLVETGANISAIGVDASGEVLLTDLSGGRLLRLVPAP